jgi:hypothetical protein
VRGLAELAKQLKQFSDFAQAMLMQRSGGCVMKTARFDCLKSLREF